MVQLLLANRADVSPQDSKQKTPLDLAENAREGAIADVLRKHGAKPGRQIPAEEEP